MAVLPEAAGAGYEQRIAQVMATRQPFHGRELPVRLARTPGEPPFIRDTVPEIFVAHLHDTPVPLSQLNPTVPGDLEAVVLRCLEKRPDHRYPSAAALNQALAGCVGDAPWAEEQATAWWRQHYPEQFTSAPPPPRP